MDESLEWLAKPFFMPASNKRREENEGVPGGKRVRQGRAPKNTSGRDEPPGRGDGHHREQKTENVLRFGDPACFAFPGRRSYFLGAFFPGGIRRTTRPVILDKGTWDPGRVFFILL